MLGEREPEIGEEGGGGVAAGEEDVEEFGADLSFVVCLGDKLREEDVAG